ncbi:unnamed protein product [Symbiodinium sp. CCMP2592]|nr:unnamed protein product [Symbiodinium sp. CCMP2592]
MPMVTGHNCMGAVLYPIPMVDFIMADVTDSMLDGVISGFPNTYASKVGKTSDGMYKACFSSYMSMMCSSIFPRCTTPFSRAEFSPVGGRVPMCFPLCILPLVLCPGCAIISRVKGRSRGASVLVESFGRCGFLPLLLLAYHQVTCWQYQSFDDANPFPRECPPADYSDNSLDGPENPRLYDDNAAGTRQSVLGQEQEILLRGSATAASLSNGVGGQPSMASRGGFRKPVRSGALVPERQDDGAGLSADTADLEEVESEEVEQGLEDSSDGSAAGAPSSHAGELPVVKV